MAASSAQIDLINIKPKACDQLLLLMPPKVEKSTSSNPNMDLFLISQNSPPVPIPLVQKPYFQSVRGYISNKKEVGNVCRTCYCGVFSENFVKLYDDNNKSFSEKLRQMLLKVSPDTDLDIYLDPVMCNTCVKLLSTSYEFKTKCATTDEKFTEWITQRKGVEKNDVKLLILVENCSGDDLNESKDKSEMKETKLSQDVVNFVDMDHNYASSVPTKILRAKIKKKFCFQTKLNGKKMKRSMKKKRVVLKGPFLCDRCSKITDNYQNYKTHLLLHFDDAEKNVVYKCSRCGYRTKSCLALKKHTRKHSEKTFDCKYCGKGYRSLKKLKFHVTNIHENSRTYLCHICGLELDSFSSVRAHTASHNLKQHRKWICEKCDEKFYLKKDYMQHMLYHPICNTYMKKPKGVLRERAKKFNSDNKTVTDNGKFENKLGSLNNDFKEQRTTIDDLDEFQKIENQLLNYFEGDEHMGDENNSSVYLDVIRKKIITMKELESLS